MLTISGFRESVSKEDGELVYGHVPFLEGHFPFFLRVNQGEIDDFECCVLVWESALCLDDLSDLSDGGLNGICGVYDLSDHGMIGKEWANPGPVSLPHARDGWIFFIPNLFECLQGLPGVVFGFGGIDLLEIGGSQSAVFP